MSASGSFLFDDAPKRPRAGSANARLSIDGSPILTVSQFTRAIRTTLERQFSTVWISGEIANLRIPSSGHCYLTLKDESAQVSAVLWRTAAEGLRFQLKDGLAVLVQGEVTVYEPRGQYQVVLRRIEPQGLGALQLAFLQLRDRLAAEGLFDPARKKPLPAFPSTVALVTSPTGAAVRDMLRVIEQRFPVRVLVCPVRVQGAEAAGEIAEMIRRVNALPDVDVMIVGRGGGSLEDLWAFNEEVVARAIAASRVPVISAVGHETDFTIADFVADARALTPTDAGNQAVPDLRQALAGLNAYRNRLAQSLLGCAQGTRHRLDGLARHYDPSRFIERVRQREQRLDDLCQQILRLMNHRLELERRRLESAAARLESLSPLAVLARGYSITFREDGAVLRDAGSLKPGDRVRTRLQKGSIRTVVESAGEMP